MIRLNQEWTDLLHKYKRDHQDPRNQTCHRIGIPLIAGSIPVGRGAPAASRLPQRLQNLAAG